MLKKRSFPDDWSDLSLEQVSDNIGYLLKNYKRYNISKSGTGTISIGNVNISKEYIDKKVPWEQRICINVNGKQICASSDKLTVFNDMLNLREMCEFQMLPFKQRAKEWCAYNPGWIVSGVAAAFTALLVWASMAGLAENNKAAKPQLKKEITDTVKARSNNNTINYYNQKQR
jgi:hypothetical protein